MAKIGVKHRTTESRMSEPAPVYNLVVYLGSVQMPWSRRLSTCFGAWPNWAHPSRPFMGPICLGRNHSQVYPHMRAKFGHDRSSRLAAYT